MNKKPDALTVLAVLFGLGIIISTMVHKGDQHDPSRYAKSAGLTITTSYYQ